MKTVLVISHVPFEDLGTLETELRQSHYKIEHCDASTGPLDRIDPLAFDLLIVLGGPIGVYEQEQYPFLATEIALLQARLGANLPTLGICLGAQLMAAALGANVFPGKAGKELGWKPLTPAPDTDQFPAMRHLLQPGLPVLHWHGDTFELPAGALHLAATDQYAHQAFTVGRYALGLQFHPEVTATGLERWYVGHACELAQAKIDVAQLRQQSHDVAPRLELAAQQFWREWLQSLPSTHPGKRLDSR